MFRKGRTLEQGLHPEPFKEKEVEIAANDEWLGHLKISLNDARPAVDDDDLAGDVATGIRGEQQHGPFDIVFVTELSERRLLNHPDAMFDERRCRHFRDEESRREGVDANVLRPPFGAQGARHVDDGSLGGVIGDRSAARGVMTEQSLDRGNIDHGSFALRKKRRACYSFGEQEQAGDIEVNDLVPSFERILFGRSSPRRTGIVDQDIDPAELRHDPLDDSVRGIGAAEISGERMRRYSKPREMGDGIVEFRFLACDEGDGGAIFAQRFGCLEPETARTAGDDPDAPRQVKQARKRRTHRASEPKVARPAPTTATDAAAARPALSTWTNMTY